MTHSPAAVVVPDGATVPDPLAALRRLGWRGPDLEPFALGPGERPARVARLDRGRCTLLAADELLHAPLDPTGEPPAVGDWAVIRTLAPGVARLARLLPRRSAFVRHAAGDVTEGQVAAANVDVAFVVAALDTPLNLRRLERYLALAWQSGATPAVLLTKADRASDPEAARLEAERVTLGVPVHLVSAVTGQGLDDVHAALAGDRTAVLLGMSGAGKSTLANALAGAPLMDVQDVRIDGQGRHTTTHRELLVLPRGGVLIDTPGMRTMLLWEADEGISHVFADIEELAATCRFRDCAHQGEPGCAVEAAVAGGAVDADRLRSWRKLGRELEMLARRQDGRAAAETRRQRRVLGRSLRLQEELRRRPKR